MKRLMIAAATVALASVALAGGPRVVRGPDLGAEPGRFQIETEPSPDDAPGRIRNRAKPAAAKTASDSVPDAQEERLGDPAHSFFLLISGGVNYANNKIRFWADTATYYSTLRLKYKVPKENITLLVSDGGADTPDAVVKTNIGGTNYLVYVSSPADMDGDGVPDVDGPADFVTVTNALTTLERKLTPKDQLTVFIASHGSPIGEASPDNRDCVAWLFDTTAGQNEFITDYELAELTKGIGCPVGFAIEACYSGGFIDDITNVPDRVIATACRNDQRSIGMDSAVPYEYLDPFVGAVPLYNCWALPFNCAVRGAVPLSVVEPGSCPWQNDDSEGSVSYCRQADVNGDGLVSFREAFEFSAEFDRRSDPASEPYETPQFAESAPGLGERFFTLKPVALKVTPGGPLGPYETAEAAANAMASAEFAPSAEVAAKLGSGSTTLAGYCAKFGLEVVPTSDGKWSVAASLEPESWTNVVLSAQAATRQIPVSRIAEWRTDDDPIPVTLTNCVPGFYYSLYQGSTLTDFTAAAEANGNVLCGADMKVVLPEVTKPSDGRDSGFFTVGVLAIPTVCTPGEKPVITGHDLSFPDIRGGDERR